MKKILLIIFITLSCLESYAVYVSTFSVHDNYLYGGKIKVWGSGTSGFVSRVGLTRNYSGNSFENVNLQARLVVFDGGVAVDISKDYQGNSTILTFNGWDFWETGVESSYSSIKDMIGHIPVAYENNTVYLQVRQDYNNNGTWTDWTNAGTTYDTVGPTIFSEALLLLDVNNGAVYLVIDGIKRHIETSGTLETLCVNGRNYTNFNPNNSDDPFSFLSTGSPINWDIQFIRHTVTGKIYWREGTVIRHIYTAEAGDKYQFRWRYPYYTNVGSISAYTVGAIID